MGAFIVERYWPGVTEADVRLLNAVLRTVGGPTAFLGSILMVADEVVLCRFEATSADQVERISAEAGLRCDRVVSAVFLDPTG